MSDYTPEAGHRVRVTIEGEVYEAKPHGIRIANEYGIFVYYNNNSSGYATGYTATVERLPDPEPEWQPGDVVRDAGGRTFMRTDCDEWRDFCGKYFLDKDLTRPVTRLVPENNT